MPFNFKDECSDANDKKAKFILHLRQLYELTNLRQMLTSRPMASIQADYQDLKILEIQASDSDIHKFLEAQMNKEPRLGRHVKLDPAFQKLIIETMISNAKGM